MNPPKVPNSFAIPDLPNFTDRFTPSNKLLKIFPSCKILEQSVLRPFKKNATNLKNLSETLNPFSKKKYVHVSEMRIE